MPDEHCLLQKPLRERRALLHDLLEEESGYVEFVKHIDIDLAICETESIEEDVTKEADAETTHVTTVVRNCLEKAVASGCEGLMVKALDDTDSEYKAGRRSFSWMKLKHDYLLNQPTTTSQSNSGRANGTFLGDTLDLVPIGAFYGKGRRAGVYGSFLMATYNTTSGKFEVSMSKVALSHGPPNWFSCSAYIVSSVDYREGRNGLY